MSSPLSTQPEKVTDQEAGGPTWCGDEGRLKRLLPTLLILRRCLTSLASAAPHALPFTFKRRAVDAHASVTQSPERRG